MWRGGKTGGILWLKQLSYQSLLFRKPHVSHERSSCFSLFLNFWVSLRSCRLFRLVPPLFPVCLALTGEGTGGLIPFSFLAVGSSLPGWPCVNFWT